MSSLLSSLHGYGLGPASVDVGSCHKQGSQEEGASSLSVNSGAPAAAGCPFPHGSSASLMKTEASKLEESIRARQVHSESKDEDFFSDEEKTFSMRELLKKETKDEHRRAERSPIMRAILRRTITKEQLGLYLLIRRQMSLVLEDALTSCSEDWDPRSCEGKVYDFFRKLYTSEGLQESLIALGEEKAELPTSLQGLLLDFESDVDRFRNTQPRRLFWIAWMLMLDGFFGGVILRKRIAEKFEKEFGPEVADFLAYPEVVDSKGKPLLNKEMTMREAAPVVKKYLEKHFDGFFNGIDWTDKDFEEAASEMKASFGLVADIFEAIIKVDQTKK